MTVHNWVRSIDRRTFLQILSFTGITGLIYPRQLISSLVPSALSRVVIIEDDTATNGILVNKDTIQLMIDSGLKALTNQNDIGEACKTLFPGINSSHTIAVKVNSINSSLPTHLEVTDAVVYNLKQMNFEGDFFPENNIIIYDRRNDELISSGYTINTSDTGVRCHGTSIAGVGYTTETFDVNGKNQKLSKIVTEMADYLVNISVLKNITEAGVTLCLKNHYGTCHNPEVLHGNDCDPYIPALNALTPIITKQSVNICDALLGIKTGSGYGPPQFTANKIIISKDIVAVDYLGMKILEDNGAESVPLAHHIETAAVDYHLGTNDPAQMDIVTITNPTTGINTLNNDPDKPGIFLIQQNYPNPFNNQTQIRFYVAKPEQIILSIFDSRGQRIRMITNQVLRTGWHQITWNGDNDTGKPVASGIYICQMTAGSYQKAILMQLLK